MHSDQLTLQVCRQLRDLHSIAIDDPFDLIGVIFTFGRLLKVDTALIPGRYLYSFESNIRSPFANGFQGVKRRNVAHELSKKNSRTFNSSHDEYNNIKLIKALLSKYF